MKKTVKTALTVFMLIVAIPLFCRAEENVYLSTAAGGTETASIGDVLTVHKEDVPSENVCVFYVDNEKYGGISDTLTVTAEMLGKTVYAQVTYGNKTVSTNSVKINAEAPTLELSGVAGDYSAYLTWSAKGNGSDIEKYEIKYALSASPDNIISTQTYQKSASSATITGLTGGIEHIISLTAYNAVGSVTSYVKITPNDPDLATITAVKNEIEASNIAIHMNIANTAAAVKDYLKTYFGRYGDYGVAISDIAVLDFTAAEQKSVLNPDALTGSFVFVVEITKGDASVTTKKISAEIDNSVSMVYINANKFSVVKGETLTVTARSVDIEDDTFKWYKAAGKADEGTLIEGVTSSTYTVPTDKAEEFYIYCVCGGISSSRIKLTVTEPFVAISDIELSTDNITVSQSTVLYNTVFPSNATNKTVVWSIENDGGCIAELNGRTITAYKPGTVTVKATVKDGGADGDYEKIFYISVKERSADETTPDQTDTDTDDESKIYTIDFDCEKISGIESVTVTAENGNIQITSVTDETVERILSGAGIDITSNKIIGAVKFVYADGAIAHNTEIKIKGYDNTDVKVLSVNTNGGVTVTEQKPNNGSVYGNAISADVMILLFEDGGKNGRSIFLYAALLVIPALGAAGFIAYIAVKDDKKRKKKIRSK